MLKERPKKGRGSVEENTEAQGGREAREQGELAVCLRGIVGLALDGAHIAAVYIVSDLATGIRSPLTALVVVTDLCMRGTSKERAISQDKGAEIGHRTGHRTTRRPVSGMTYDRR